MTARTQNRPLIYPMLGALFDLGYVRVSGVGLGNCFYSYFHALVLRDKFGGKLIEPPWLSIKIGHILRGERANRIYLLARQPDEIGGLRKLVHLVSGFPSRNFIAIEPGRVASLAPKSLNIVWTPVFTFQGLHEHRGMIRERLLKLVFGGEQTDWLWGAAPYAAVHVRLGDFRAMTNTSQLISGKDGTRIPLSWYVAVIQELQRKKPGLEIRIFSDGRPGELRPLLDLGTIFHAGKSDVHDLLDLAAASVLVGSKSTYSRWAAFLGNMPTVWLETEGESERPTDVSVPLVKLPLNGEPDLGAL